MQKTQDWYQPYTQSVALCGYIDDGGRAPRKVSKLWRCAFSCVAKYLGFNKATRRILWEQLVQGNWDRLHQTEEEARRTPEEWLDKLYWQVSYCSDRWSLDRLSRCHWLYRQYMEACGEVA